MFNGDDQESTDLEALSETTEADSTQGEPGDNGLQPVREALEEEATNLYQTPRDAFRLASANLQGKVSTEEHLRNIIASMRLSAIDALCAQETALRPNTIQVIQGYTCHTSKRIGNSRLSLLIICKNAKFQRIAFVKRISTARIQVYEVRFNGNVVYFVNYHRPYEGCRQMSREDFDIDMLGVKEALKGHMVIFAGDSNAQPDLDAAKAVGALRQEFAAVIASWSSNDSTFVKHIGSHGHRLLNFAFLPSVNREIGVPSDLPIGVTWTGPPPNFPKRCLDHIFVSPTLENSSISFFRRGALHATSDHLVVCATFRLAPRKRPGSNIPGLAMEDIKAAASEHPAPKRHRAAYGSSRRSRSTQRKLTEMRAQSTPENMTLVQRRELNKYERRLKRQLKRLQYKRWEDAMQQIQISAVSGKMRKTFEILKDILNIARKDVAATDHDLRKAAEATIATLTGLPPCTALEMPEVEERPDETDTTPTQCVTAFTDGSKFRKRGRMTRAGAGVVCRELGLSISCQVPTCIHQTSTAGEVTAVLLLLRATRALPPEVSLRVISDNTYVVYVINYALEIYQQQDFSDTAHPDLWREVARELVMFPRVVKAEWVRAHTGGTDELSRGNAEADVLAKTAAKGRVTHEPPTIDTHPVCSPVRGKEPTFQETCFAIQLIPKKSVGGLDGIRPAGVAGSADAKARVHEAVLEAWRTGRIPYGARDSGLTFVPKADVNALPRGITLKSVVQKIIMTLISNRLKVIQLLPLQYGFSRARDTLMPIKILLQMIRTSRKNNRRFYCIFIDFENAYDTVDRPTLYGILRKHNVPEQVIDIIRSAYEDGSTYVMDTDIEFKATRGVPQGDPASPFLFSLALDAAIRNSSLVDAPFMCLAYADDMVIFGEDPEEIQRHLDSFLVQAERLGLKVNIKKGKTEAMCVLPPEEASMYIRHKLELERDMSGQKGKPPTPKELYRGALAQNPRSTTADTHNGQAYTVLSREATHLWCPLCDLVQKEHSATPEEALRKMQAHFAKHPGKRVSMVGAVTLPGLTRTYRDRRNANPIPPFSFTATVKGHLLLIPWTLEYKYLGLMLNHLASDQSTIADRVVKGRASFFTLKELWSAPSPPTFIKVWLYETIVLPRVLYGLASCVLRKEEIATLEKFHTETLLRVLRAEDTKDVFGAKLTLTYDEIVRFANTEPIMTTLARMRVSLAGRIARSNRTSTVHNMPEDEWYAQVAQDIRTLDPDRKFCLADLSNKYRCRQLVERDNTPLFRMGTQWSS